jgi:hypothetical protein
MGPVRVITQAAFGVTPKLPTLPTPSGPIETPQSNQSVRIAKEVAREAAEALVENPQLLGPIIRPLQVPTPNQPTPLQGFGAGRMLPLPNQGAGNPRFPIGSPQNPVLMQIVHQVVIRDRATNRLRTIPLAQFNPQTQQLVRLFQSFRPDPPALQQLTRGSNPFAKGPLVPTRSAVSRGLSLPPTSQVSLGVRIVRAAITRTPQGAVASVVAYAGYKYVETIYTAATIDLRTVGVSGPSPEVAAITKRLADLEANELALALELQAQLVSFQEPVAVQEARDGV